MIKLSLRHKRAFTLVELLVVIVIIAILTTLVMFAYGNAQKNSRDNKRKSDLQAIGAAYLMHYQETKRWWFLGSELQKVQPGDTNIGPNTREGYSPVGVGAFNFENNTANSYIVSIVDALNGLGYLSSRPRDPLMTVTDDVTPSNSKASQYRKFYCQWLNTDSSAIDPTIHGIVLFARLEDPASITNPYSVDPNPNLDKCYYPNATTKLLDYEKDASTGGKMNYAIEVK